jgi:hypothetical protein
MPTIQWDDEDRTDPYLAVLDALGQAFRFAEDESQHTGILGGPEPGNEAAFDEALANLESALRLAHLDEVARDAQSVRRILDDYGPALERLGRRYVPNPPLTDSERRLGRLVPRPPLTDPDRRLLNGLLHDLANLTYRFTGRERLLNRLAERTEPAR